MKRKGNLVLRAFIALVFLMGMTAMIAPMAGATDGTECGGVTPHVTIPEGFVGLNQAYMEAQGVECTAAGWSVDTITLDAEATQDISELDTYDCGDHDYYLTCISDSGQCWCQPLPGTITIECEGECECYAPDVTICQGDDVNAAIMAAGAECIGEDCEDIELIHSVNNMVPDDYSYTVDCGGGVTCDGTVTVLPACVANAPPTLYMCQYGSLPTLLDPCTPGCDPTVDFSAVDPSTPDCYPYSVTCTDPCGGECGFDTAYGEVCVLPCVGVEIIEIAGIEKYLSDPGDGDNPEWKDVCPPDEGDRMIIPVSSTFGVKAIIENCSGCMLENVTPYITIDGPAELVEGMPDHWDLGNMQGGANDYDSTEVAWTLHCTDPGMVTVTVWVNDCAQDTVCFDQRLPGELILENCTSPCEVCVNCNLNEFTVNAHVENVGQSDITLIDAEIEVDGPAEIDPEDLSVNIGTLGPGQDYNLEWDATCTGEGTATFTITVTGYDVCGNQWITPLVCTTDTFQRNVLVDVCVEPIVDECSQVCVDNAVVSTLQQFYVRAMVKNCTQTQEDMSATLTLPAGATLVSGSLTVDLPGVCGCCEEEVEWLLQCIEPTYDWVPVEVEVSAFDKTYSNFPCDEVWLYQEEKVHLSASMGPFVEDCYSDCWIPIEVVAECQDFDVKIWVTNSGEALAQNVRLDILVEGPTDCKNLYQNVLFIDDPFDAGNNDADIPGKSTEWAWLSNLIEFGEPCHCVDEGDVIVTISNLTAMDENTCDQVLLENVEEPCPLVIPQCDIDVDIINPETCDEIEQWEKFAVKARITNCGTCTFEDVLVTLMMEGAVQLVEGSENPAYLEEILPPDDDCYECCREYEVTWMVQCVGAPDEVYFDVCVETATPHLQIKSPPLNDGEVCGMYCGPNPECFEKCMSHTVNVHQIEREDAYVCVDILSPDAGSKYATSQDFAITAEITNLECCAPITITDAYVDVSSIPWWEDAVSIGDELPPLPWVIGPGESKTVTWTAHCEASGLSWFNVVIIGESAEYEPVYEVSEPVAVWQYPAAHLEVEITGFPQEPIVTSTEFDVTYTVTNTGEADATDVYATLSVEPEGSVRVAGPSDGGYTQYIGTIPGHGSEANSVTKTYTLHCKLPCDSTIEITVDGNDEYGWHMKQQCASTGSFVIEGGGEMVEGLLDGFPLEIDEQRGWFAGFFYGDANGLIGPFNLVSEVSWAAMGGGPDFMGEVAMMGAVLPNISMTNAQWWMNCCCSDGHVTCPCACELIEGKDVMVFIGHIVSDTGDDYLPTGQEFYGAGPGLLNIINGQISGSYFLDECEGEVTWVKSLLGGEYCTNMAATASLPILAEFIEPDEVTVKQLPMLADMSIEKVADTCCYTMGDTVEFTVTLDNLGPSDATSVLVMDVLPDVLAIESAVPSQGWYDVTSGYWNVGDLAADAAPATLVITAKINTVGEVCNRATVVALDQHDPVTTNNSSEECVNVDEPAAVDQVTLYLDEGLNLISLPLMPDVTNPVTALAGVDFELVALYEGSSKTTGTWEEYEKGYTPDPGFVWEDGYGYWMSEVASGETLIIAGEELPSGATLPPSYDVEGGWNLIGFKSTTAKLPSEYLAGIEGKYVMIYGFDNDAFYAVGSPGHAMLVPGFGYWLAVKVGESGTIFP